MNKRDSMEKIYVSCTEYFETMKAQLLQVRYLEMEYVCSNTARLFQKCPMGNAFKGSSFTVCH